jgi:sulfate permease, SulP family
MGKLGMAAQNANAPANEVLEPPHKPGWRRYVPSAEWLTGYRWADLPRDLRAGLFVAVLLVPQAMAYALLADLPPKVGLWAAMAAPLLYAFFGTSRYLAVGPVALVSLIVGEAVAGVAARHDMSAVEVGLVLALMSGVVMLVLGLLRWGMLINFISGPVLTGFAAAAAVLIATSQLRHVLGLDIERAGSFAGSLERLAWNLGETDLPTLAVAAAAIVALLLSGRPLQALGRRLGLREDRVLTASRAMPLLVIVAASFVVWWLAVPGIAVVGEVGAGLPPLGWPPLTLGLVRDLVPTALTVAVLSFVTAVAVAKPLARREDPRIDPSQELVALGAANLVASVTGGYPVGGSVSRSAVAADADAASPLFSVVTAALVTVAVVYAGPLLRYMPNAVLAALIVTAVFRLIDVRTIRKIWRYSWQDGMSLAVTFLAVLLLGIELGLVIGAASGVALYLWRTSQPRVVAQGRLADTEQFRAEGHTDVEPPHSPVLVLRVDQDLYFANTEHFEDRVLEELTGREGIRCLLLDFRAVNEVDTSALEVLEKLIDRLTKAGVGCGLAEVKQPVLDRLDLVGFCDRLGRERLYVSTHEGVEDLESCYAG